MDTLNKPIFIGGTGRSGTSILSVILDKHPDVFSTRHEIKLITEPFGLINLSTHLTERWNALAGHLAIKEFKRLAEQNLYYGFKNKFINKMAKLWRRSRKIDYLILNKFPFIDYAIHSCGPRFGFEHFNNCVQGLLDQLVYHRDDAGVLDTLGMMKPFYYTRKFMPEELNQLFRNFIVSLLSEPFKQRNKHRWCDDTPNNFTNADYLLKLFPSMKLIHMLRDPRDTVSSYGKQTWASNEVDININTIINSIQTWTHFRAKLPSDSFIEIRLEDLIHDTERTLRKICDFAHLEFTPELLKVDLSLGHIGRYQKDLSLSQINKIEMHLKEWMVEKKYSFI